MGREGMVPFCSRKRSENRNEGKYVAEGTHDDAGTRP